jgi:hypothetical protein
MRRGLMKKLLLILLTALAMFCTTVYAEEAPKEAAPEEAAEEEMIEYEMPSEEAYVYVFPAIKPEATLFGGYRFVGLKGSARAEEFEFLHNSPVFGGELRLFSFPHRFHLDVDWKNRKDYFGDVSYAYKDLILFRGINRTLFHNIENITLRDLAPLIVPPAGPDVLVGDPGEDYGLKVGISSAFLRFKAPDFPFHVYVDSAFIKKEGSIQQRFLGGSGFFGNIVRVSEKKNVDWETRSVTLGANSHLGPVEVDISHGEKRFENSGNPVFFNFAQAGFPPAVVRAAGEFPHNVVPDLRSSTNTVKLHTSFTGSIVASATVSTLNKENSDFGAESDYLFGAADVTWVPMPRLAVFFKYRHRETDVDNPASATVLDNATGTIVQTITGIRPSISSITNTYSVAARYKISSGVTARAEYAYDTTNRINTDENNRSEELWFVPKESVRKTFFVATDVRLRRNLTLNLKYTRRDANSPEFNIEPDRSDEGKVSLTWIPIPQVSTLLSLVTVREKRDSLAFVHTGPDTVPPNVPEVIQSTGERRVSKNRFLGSVTFLPLKNLSLTTSYFYYRQKIREDLAFHLADAPNAGEHEFDENVPSRATSSTYAADISYAPHENITLTGGASHTLSRGSFIVSDPALLISPSVFSGFGIDSVASFSDMKMRENLFHVSGEYRFKGGFTAGVQYRYSSFRDLLGNPFDDLENGKAQIVLLTLSKKW